MFIQSSPFYMPGTVPGAGGAALDKTDMACPHGAHSIVTETIV